LMFYFFIHFFKYIYIYLQTFKKFRSFFFQSKLKIFGKVRNDGIY
jgi:hypothetical protein